MGFFGGGSSGESKITILNSGVEVGSEGSLNFIPGSNISLDFNQDTVNKRIDITIAASGGGGGGSGEANTASNLGTGSGLYKQKVGDDLQFKSLKVGSSKISLVSNANDLTFDLVESNINHNNLLNVGTNTHSQIDSHITTASAHIADTTIHFTEASIDKYTRSEVDTLLGAKANTSSLTAHTTNVSNPHSVTKNQIGLGNVENTALSTWPGSTNITTLGTISAGSIPFSLISGTVPISQGGTNATSYRLAKQNLRTFNSNFVNITSNTTLDASHDGKFLRVNSSSGAVTITLPDSVTVGSGWSVTIQKATSSSNAVVIQRAGTDTIDGAVDFSLGRYESVSLFNDGSGTFFDYNYNSYDFNSNNSSKGEILVSQGPDIGWTTQPTGFNGDALINDSTSSTGVRWGTLSIAGGGTGATTANNAFNALAPSQTSNSGKFLTTNGSNTSWSSVPVGNALRQTVLTGPVDSNGFANFIGTGSGLVPQLLASSTNPVIITASNGYDSSGNASDYKTVITSNQNFPTCAAGTTNYLYADIQSDGTYTLGATVHPWNAGTVFSDANSYNKVLANFNGTNGQTPITEAYGKTLTRNGSTASISTAQSKWGGSSLLCGSSANHGGSYDVAETVSKNLWFTEDKWGVGFWFYATAWSTNSYILSVANNASYSYLAVGQSASGGNKLIFYLSSAVGAPDILSVTTTQTYNTNQWYWVAINFDKSKVSNNYTVHVDGTQVAAATNTNKVGTGVYYAPMRIGNFSSSTYGFPGYIDDFTFLNGYNVPTSPPSAALTRDTVDFYDINLSKMRSSNDGVSFTDRTRVYLGEVLTGLSSITSTTSYAYQGKAVIPGFSTAVRTDYIKNHNLGVPSKFVKVNGIINYDSLKKWANVGFDSDYYVNSTSSGGIKIGDMNRNTVTITTLYSAVWMGYVSGTTTAFTTGDLYLTVERDF